MIFRTMHSCHQLSRMFHWLMLPLLHPCVGPAVKLPLALISTAGPSVGTPIKAAVIRSMSPVTQLISEIVTQIDPVVSLAVSSTPTKATPTTFTMLHPTPKINRTRRVGANRTTQKAAVLTSSEYRRSLSDKLESSDIKKTATKAKKDAPAIAPATEERNPTKRTKSTAKATSRSNRPKKSNSAPVTVNYYCGWCEELYDNSGIDWLQCVGCLEWWELDCSGMLGKSKKEQNKFRCPDCD